LWMVVVVVIANCDYPQKHFCMALPYTDCLCMHYHQKGKVHQAAKRPCSNHWYSLDPSKTKQSEVDPPYVIDISKNLPFTTSLTAWQFKANLFLLPQKNFFCPIPHPLNSSCVGLWIQIQMRTPSIAPAQLLTVESCLWYGAELVSYLSLLVMTSWINNKELMHLINCL
jgi:hypothetical protein